jgi:pyrimidine deaminase RibD-like protein
VSALNLPGPDGTRRHAERVAIDLYNKKFGRIPEGSIIITTLSPCSEHMDERYGESCTDLINQSGVKKVYAGFIDPTQQEEHRDFNIMETEDESIRSTCKEFANTFLKLDENFADGRNPQDKGDAKRHGINTKASVSSLRKTAKQGGRKGQLAHWLANMKAGRAKKK